MHKLFHSVLFSILIFSLNGQAQITNSANLLKQFLDLPAPAPVNTQDKTVMKKERDAEFFSDDKVPSDDAPIEDLVEYWSNKNGSYNRLKYQLKPSQKTLERLLDYSEDNPEAVTNFLSLMPTKPDIAERVKQIYDRLAENDENNYPRTTVRQWLKFNSKYYLDELIREAQQIQDRDNYVQNGDQEVLRALARVDWDSARPIINKLEYDSTQPYASTLAKWVIYQHGIDTEDSSLTERYREELQKIVENKNAAWAQRDLAMDSLVMSGDWEGRDEWYVSLLEDETLLTIQDNGYTGLTTMVALSPPDKWIEPMIKLTKSSSLAVRSAAVRNLMDIFNKDRKDILEALLPWLSNPDWAKSSNRNERLELIGALAEIEMPEAVPGLIWIVQNEKENNRAQAAKALVKNKDSRAIPVLRFALQDEENLEYRKNIIEALIACGGIGDDEQMAALEAYATVISTPEGLERMETYDYEVYEEGVEQPKKPLPLPIIIGRFISEQEEPSDGLAARAIDRLKVLRRTKPAVAKALAGIMQKWKGRVIYLETLRQIKAGEADIDAILNLLANRKNVREKIPNDVSALRTVNGISRGIGSCVAEDVNEFLSILGQTDAEAQIAMLGCARMLRIPLPVGEVGEFLKSQNNTLALAAERYLESEDSVQARTLILARHPGEAVILGARQAFIPNEAKNIYESSALDALFASVNGSYFTAEKFGEIKSKEENLRAEIKTNADLLAVYAFLPQLDKGQRVVRVFKDKIVFTFYEDQARYWQKALTTEEYQRFYNFLIENRIDGFSAFNGSCEGCISDEFVMFGRNGGRRVFFRSDEEMPVAVVKLREYFESFGAGELKLNYNLSNKVKGLEVILSDEMSSALAVWKKDGDFRVLIEDKAKQQEIEKDLTEREKAENAVEIEDDSEAAQMRYQAQAKRRSEVALAHFFWRKVEGGKLGAVLPQPSEAAFLPDGMAQILENAQLNPSPRAWQVRSGNLEIRTDNAEGNLYKISRTQNPVKIREGNFSNPVVTGDGKWVVASKVETDSSEPNGVVRVNLQTGAEFKINLPPADTFLPVAFVASQNKVLLYRAKGKTYRGEEGVLTPFEEEREYEEYYRRLEKTKPNPSPKIPEYYLLDANTGAVQMVKGEFRPLIQQTYRPLQPTSNPGEFWAAVTDEKTKSTQIGRYSEKTFTLQPVINIPDINLSSMQIWVDENEAKVYFVYQGHLLALPLS